MIRLDPWACVAWAGMVLLLPLQWLLAAVTAAAFHELCHMGAVYALGGEVREIRIGPAGAVMDVMLPGKGRELLAALAGPAGSFLLLFLHRGLPHIALCGLFQGLFNLLPLYPLDGGRVLRCALDGHVSRRWQSAIEGCLAVLAAMCFLRISAVFGVLLVIRSLFGKIPCKRRRIGVQ